MSKVLSVAWREFKQTVLRKVFLLAIFGIPILIVGAMALAMLVMMGHQEPPLVGKIAIADPSGEVIGAAGVEFDPQRIAGQQQKQIEEIEAAAGDLFRPGVPPPATFEMGEFGGRGTVDVEIEPHDRTDEETIDALKDRVWRGDLIAAAVVTDAVLANPDPEVPQKARAQFDLYVAEAVDADHASFIEARLGEAIVRVRAERAELNPDEATAMLRRPLSNTRRLLEGGQESREGEGLRELKQIIPIVFMMLLWGAVIASAQHLMMSTIEEKSNRVMEVLLSAVSPLQLMTGKIFGHCGVGLLIVVIYSALPLAGLFAFDQQHRIEMENIAYLFVFFFMAYFMMGSIMAAVGSAVTDIREANTLVTPVMLLMMIPLMLWLPISQAPNGSIATTFSFIPPAIPFVMILRLAADESVPWWQIPATVLWGYACVVGMVWMAAKIFRVGVLMYGKPPSPIQLLKWLRYS
ncbi:MAG: ABC transporter permease [Planctomycetota bacterium]|jgi:ABC-2 type transport system permease protein